MTTYRTICYDHYGDPQVMRLEDREMLRPGPGQVLVRIEAAGVAPLDWKLRAGHLKAFFSPDFPKTPGRDGAGTVLATGDGAGAFGPGDRVAVMAPPAGSAGTHAEVMLAEAAFTVAVPEVLSLQDAAALTNSGLSALIAVERTAAIEPGQRVLVQGGSGAVGGLIVQLCAAKGAEVTATCRSANTGYVESLGAARAIAYDEPFPGDLPPQDVVFDLMGGAVHDACYPLLAPGGHLVWLTAAPIRDRGSEFGVRVSRAMIADDADVVSRVLELAADGVLKAQIAGTLPLVQAAEAQRRLAAGEVTRGRLLLLP